MKNWFPIIASQPFLTSWPDYGLFWSFHHKLVEQLGLVRPLPFIVGLSINDSRLSQLFRSSMEPGTQKLLWISSVTNSGPHADFSWWVGPDLVRKALQNPWKVGFPIWKERHQFNSYHDTATLIIISSKIILSLLIIWLCCFCLLGFTFRASKYSML